MICPNKNHPLWKIMVKKYGEAGAKYKWFENGYKMDDETKPFKNETRVIPEDFNDERLNKYLVEENIFIPHDEQYKDLYKVGQKVPTIQELESDIDYAYSKYDSETDEGYKAMLQSLLASYWIQQYDNSMYFQTDGRGFYLVKGNEIIGKIAVLENKVGFSKIADDYQGKGYGQILYQSLSASLQALVGEKLVSYKNFVWNEVNGETKEHAREAWNKWVNKGLAIDEGERFVMLQNSYDGIEKNIEELDNYLLEFFKSFNVSSKEFVSLKEKLGVDAIGATDVINKMIYYTENRNIETIPEEIGHMAVMLMGETNPIIKQLHNDIMSWDEYDNVFDEYRNIYKDKNGQVDHNKIRIEAMGKLIAKALVKNYKANGLDKTMLEKILDALSTLVAKIKSLFGYNTSLYLADKIALNILLGNKEFISKITTNRPQLNYQEALSNNPFAQDIINTFSSLNAKLGGSLAIAGQGENIYRPSEEPIHDIDFKVSKEDFIKIEKLLKDNNAMPIHDGWSNSNKNYITFSYIFPREGYTIIEKSRDHNNWLRNYELLDENGIEVEANASNSMSLDFFVGENKETYKGIFSSASDIYEGKLSLSTQGNDEKLFQRGKDQIDYQLRNPVNKEQLSSQIYYQLSSVETTPNTSLEKSKSQLDFMNNNYRKGESGQYEDKNTGKVVTYKTASQMKKEDIEETEYGNKASEIGTNVHIVYEQILKDLYEEKEPKNQGQFSDVIFYSLLESATNTYEEIKRRQAQINIENNYDKKFEIRFEQVLIDRNKKFKDGEGIGGSMDILVLFSDNTAAIYDIKTMFSAGKINDKGEVPYFQVKDKKREMYKAQIGTYVDILKRVIGVKEVVMRRVIPVVANYNIEDNTLDISTQGKSNVLSNLLVGKEKIGIEKFDKWLDARLNLVKTIEFNLKIAQRNRRTADELNKSKYLAEELSLKEKIKKVNESIELAFLKQDFSKSISTIYDLDREINQELNKDLADLNLSRINELIEELETVVDLQEVSLEMSKVTGELENENYRPILYKIRNTLFELKNTRDILTSESYHLQSLFPINRDRRMTFAAKNLKSDGWIMSMLGNISDQSNPIFQKLYKDILGINAEIAFDLQKYTKDLIKYTSIADIDKIVDKKTGKLITKLDYSSLNHIREMKQGTLEEQDKKIKEILKYYEYKDFDENKIISEYISTLDKVFKENGVFKGETQKEKDITKFKYDNMIKDFQKFNLWTIEGKLNPDAILSLFKSYKLTLKNEDKYLSKEYKELNKEQKEALSWFEDMSKEFRIMLNISENKLLPNNFIPLLRKDLIDRWRDSDDISQFVSSQFNLMKDSLNDLATDTQFGKRNELPIKFLRSSKNISEVSPDQSFDLFNTFQAFSQFAFHYKHYYEVIPRIQALRELILDKAIVNDEKVTENDATMKQFDDYVNYNVFKVKAYKEQAVEDLSTVVSMNKVIEAASNYLSLVALGGNLSSSTASHIAGRTAVFIEAKKGNMFTVSQHNKAVKDMLSNRTNYLAFCGFFNIYPDADAHRVGLDPHEHHWISNSHPDKVKAYVGSRNSLLFKSWQWGEEDVTNVVTVSMGQNYGIEDGKLKHLQFLPKDAKSIYETMEYNKETGQISFKDINGKEVELQQLYRQFRQTARAGIRNTVGTANEEDMARYKMYLAGRMFMKFSTWLPGVFLERFRKTRVNEYAQVMEMGRYNALFGNYFDKEDFKSNKMNLLKGSVEMSKDIISNFFGMGSMVGQNFWQLDKDKARHAFNKWKEQMREENPYEIEKLEELTTDEDKQLELFIKAKQGQLIASIIELRIFLGLIGLILAIGAAVPPEDDKLKDSLATRKFIKLTDKVRTEIGFIFSTPNLVKKLQEPFPLVSSLMKLGSLIANTGDETRDLFFGENQISEVTGKSKDKTEKGYYLKHWLIGYNIIESLGLDSLFE